MRPKDELSLGSTRTVHATHQAKCLCCRRQLQRLLVAFLTASLYLGVLPRKVYIRDSAPDGKEPQRCLQCTTPILVCSHGHEQRLDLCYPSSPTLRNALTMWSPVNAETSTHEISVLE